MKKLLCVLVGLLMLVPILASCKLTDEEPAASAAPLETEAPSVDLERDAVAATVGDMEITYGEVQDLFDMYSEYFAYYGYDVTSDPATLASFQDDLITMLVDEKLVILKGEELGYGALTDEQKAELDARLETELQEIDSYYREQAITEASTDPSVNVDARVLELILEEAAYNLGTADVSYELYTEYIQDELKATYIGELLKEGELADVTASEDDIAAQFNTLLEADTATYTETPSAYKLAQETYESEGLGLPAMYVPEGYSRIYDIFIAFEGELPDDYTTKQSEMKTLKTEYQELSFADAVSGIADNADRLAEILAQYKTLSDECDVLYAEYESAAKAKTEELYAQLQSGADFKTLLLENTENENFTTSDMFAQRGLLIAGGLSCDYDWTENTKEIFANLAIGEYSEPFAEKDGYHIIYYVGDETPGARTLEGDVLDAVTASVIEANKTAEWATLMELWRNEEGVVTLYEDVYRLVGTL